MDYQHKKNDWKELSSFLFLFFLSIISVWDGEGGGWVGNLIESSWYSSQSDTRLPIWYCTSGGEGRDAVHFFVCMLVCMLSIFSVLYSFTAVISAHPIHSLDNPHHHFHSGSLASPTRSYLHHQVNPWPIGTSMSHSDRANSTGEKWSDSCLMKGEPFIQRVGESGALRGTL